MEYNELKLGDGTVLKSYIREDLSYKCDSHRLRPGIIVLPGGGYEYLSPRESEPIVLEFLSRGYNLFVVEYAVTKEEIKNKEPEKEVAEAISFIRKNKDRFRVKEDNLALMGFSAGGHAALSLGVHWEKYGESSRPDALVLSYPVVTMGEWTHEGSRDNLTRGEKERIEYFSLENHVTASIPPTFVWHTTEDKSVPPMNTIMLLEALEKAGAYYEYHIFTKGKHGLSTCRKDVGSPERRAENWMDLADSWLSELFSFQM